jgi:hypothetical protein
MVVQGVRRYCGASRRCVTSLAVMEYRSSEDEASPSLWQEGDGQHDCNPSRNDDIVSSLNRIR